MTIMTIDEETWKLVQQHLGYSDEEMTLFRSDPRNLDALSKTAVMLNKTIVVEVVDSHGCDSGHKVGDKFHFDGRGISLLAKKGPSRICIFALHCGSGGSDARTSASGAAAGGTSSWK